ncbi:atherin-like [Sarcophilus harrisii]|uniref:atherin-like n=1 Tax=Sarcophilus harrisii TaxID=9305 RepID=UPI001301B4D5|nr:atherin-like [Sarcophilus harrisii]
MAAPDLGDADSSCAPGPRPARIPRDASAAPPPTPQTPPEGSVCGLGTPRDGCCLTPAFQRPVSKNLLNVGEGFRKPQRAFLPSPPPPRFVVHRVLQGSIIYLQGQESQDPKLVFLPLKASIGQKYPL